GGRIVSTADAADPLDDPVARWLLACDAALANGSPLPAPHPTTSVETRQELRDSQACLQLLGRRVALKVPRAEALLTPELRARFLREARAAAALDHPGVVRVHE